MSDKTSSKVLEIQVSNCEDYKTTLSLGGKTYTGSSSLGITEIPIDDIETVEKILIVKLVGTGMNDFRKSLKVKKDEQNTQPKEFNVRKLKLWSRDIKDVSSIVVNDKDAPKALEIEVENCNNYAVTAQLQGHSYTGNASEGKVNIPIADLPTEEKSLVIKLTGTDMKDFTKTVSVKKDEQNTQPKEFDVAKLNLWGHDIKDVSSIIVNAKDAPKIVEVGVSNCNNYNVTMLIGDANYQGVSTLGVAQIAINDIPEEEKTVVIKLTSVGMKDFSKSLKVKKEVETVPSKEFNVTRMRLWGHNIKDVSSLVVNAKDAPKALEIEVENCNNYVVNAQLGEQKYTGNATSGKVSIEIQDLPTVEKSLIISLTGDGMKDFTKSLKLKKTTENIQLEDFNVTKIKLWGHDIKDESSVVVNGKDEPKTLEIEVENCVDYRVDARLGEKNYTGDSASNKVSIEIIDIPKDEKVFSIKLSASGKKEWNNTITVKRVDLDFKIAELSLWGHDIKNKTKVNVSKEDSPKALCVRVINCDEYLVTASLNGNEYIGNATSGEATIEISTQDVPVEEKELIIKLSALGMNDIVKIIKVQRILSDFNMRFLQLWGHDIEIEDKLTVYANDEPKTLNVSAINCREYSAKVNLDGKTYTGNTTSGTLEIPIEDIPLEEKKLIITVSSPLMKDFVKTIRVKKEFPDALDLKVFFKTSDDNLEKEIIKDGNPQFSTTQVNGEVIIRTRDSIMSKVSINGYNVALSSDGKTATYNIDTSSDVAVTVEVEFEVCKKAKRTFTVKKYTNQTEIPFQCNTAKIISGDDEETALNFDSNNKASVKLNNIQYSCVKLVMDMNKSLTSAILEECKDGRSASYKTNPSQEDVKGIFSGRLVKEADEDGNVTKTYTPINEKTYTEYLIVGAGEVEYKFKITSSDGSVKNYTINITNKNDDKVRFGGGNPTFYASHGYGVNTFLSGPPVWRWSTYSKLPFNGEDSWASIADLEYMGDRVKMLFAKFNNGAPGEMYFYYNVFDDPNTNKKEFVRIIGKNINNAVYFTRASFDPEEKYVDAFVGFKDYLPQPLLPLQTQKKWKKLFDKGFLFQVENGLRYSLGNYEETSLGIFYNVFNYRVQAKTYANDAVLNMGYKQKYMDMFDGGEQSISNPFLDGGKKDNGIPNDLMLMVPTFAGKIADSISSASYTIKKNGSEEASWQNINIPVDKLGGFICLNAKPENYLDDGKLKDSNTMYAYEKGSDGNENNYEIDVTITPKTGTAKTYKYKIDYKTEQTQTLMSLHNGKNMNSSLFGIPTSYAELANRKVQAMFREAMGKDLVRKRLINR